MNKRLKLPNGFGSITRKTGRRRRPFEIRKWIDGKQKVIGYEVTYESALAFLCEYNKNPLLFSPSKNPVALCFNSREQDESGQKQNYPDTPANISILDRISLRNKQIHCHGQQRRTA